MTARDAIMSKLPGGQDPDRPVLIAGPTASGKSALALAIAEAHGGVIVNADAIQVFANWSVLTARPDPTDIARAPHKLYGHIPGHHEYSVGNWLRELTPILRGPKRPIIVGGTGLYFAALTQGLADIPAIPDMIRDDARRRIATNDLPGMVDELDAESAAVIDLQNPARVARAWEVLQATGRGIASWQAATPPPLLEPATADCIVLHAPKEWLTPRIQKRFDLMMQRGALDEARANLAQWRPDAPSSKAIGAPELIAHLKGETSLADARDRAVIATRQFAKRQRTWFNARMKHWTVWDCTV
jgi:tRNA dimethylallyltransferase